MARKGNKKVRTGCLTCKSRKVKCDEIKPLCKRCTDTGRQCAGYAAAAPTLRDNSFGLLLLSQGPHHPLGASSTKEEGRALQYFYTSAGPLLSSYNEQPFWMKLVMQFTEFEPAVRHSVVAISLLHEQMHASTDLGTRLPARKDDFLSIKHYNLAIRELKSMDTIEKQPVVLFVCILFICIEMLQDNRDMALQHCRHGLAILSQVVYRYPWTQHHFIPIFRRLSAQMYLFASEAPDYSTLDAFAATQYDRFESFSDARAQMDEIFRRTLRLVKRGEEYRVGSYMGQPVAEDLLEEGGAVNSMLDHWNRMFTAYDDKLSMMTKSAAMALYDLDNTFLFNMVRMFLATRYDVCRMLVSTAFTNDELVYDTYMDMFKRAVESFDLLDLSPDKDPEDTPRPLKFVFEMAFQPIIFFVVTKCRDIKLRLRALRLMKVVGVPQESMWNVHTTFHMCRRVIEIEHGVLLDVRGKPTTPLPLELPPASNRICEVSTDAQITKQIRRGKIITGRRVTFLMPAPGGGMETHMDFLCDQPDDLEDEVAQAVCVDPSLTSIASDRAIRT